MTTLYFSAYAVSPLY